MQHLLLVIDMQNDFIDMALGTEEAVKIVPIVEEIIKSHKGKVIFTKDTHLENYMSTKEGARLPVPHCIKGTQGWEICDALKPYASEIIEKKTFGSLELIDVLRNEDNKERVGKITLVGLCTDICVISNAMIAKATLTEAEVEVISSACAGVTPATHQNALEAMKMCQITVK